MARNHGPFIVAIPQDDDVIHFRTRAALARYRTTQAFERAPRLDPTGSTLLGEARGRASGDYSPKEVGDGTITPPINSSGPYRIGQGRSFRYRIREEGGTMCRSRVMKAGLFGGFLWVVLWAGLANHASGQTFPGAEAASDEECRTPALRLELLRRMKVDQEIRFALLEEMRQKPAERGRAPQPSEPTLQKLQKIDEGNRVWLQKVIEKQGWPVQDLVAEDGGHAAWLLVQHADADPEFQARCLELMKACPLGQVAQVDIAYLEDRIRSARGEPQLYGTQVEFKEGQWRVKPVENRKGLDDLRASVGLPPIDEYLERVRKMQAGEVKKNETKEQVP